MPGLKMVTSVLSPKQLIEWLRGIVATSEHCHAAVTKLNEGGVDTEVVVKLLIQHICPSGSGCMIPSVAMLPCITNIELRGVVNLGCAALYVKSVTGSCAYPELTTLTEVLYTALRIDKEVSPEMLAEGVLRFKALAPELYEELEQMKSDDVCETCGPFCLVFQNNP